MHEINKVNSVTHFFLLSCSPIYRIAEVFMSENSPMLKEMVLKHFIEEDSVTRIVCYTEAFGMVLDCPNIKQVIHFSPSKTVEGYIQEIG